MKHATVIQIDPDILSGTPVFAGTRVPAGEAKDALLARAQRPTPSAVDLLDSWLEEDSKLEGGLESWELLKRNLDRDRPSRRPLFP